MGAKALVVKPILAARANAFIKANHYSGKVAPNSQLHLGVFWEGRLEGCLQFGPGINKKGTIKNVPGTSWYGFLELNRMAFTDTLPRNSESRAISVALKLIKKHKPSIKWIVSFADATVCGTGTIYRAAGFKLAAIKPNSSLRQLPDGRVMHDIQAYHLGISKDTWRTYPPLKGYQIKYIYKLDNDYTGITTLPYSALDDLTYPKGVTHHRRRNHKSNGATLPGSTRRGSTDPGAPSSNKGILVTHGN